MKRKLFYIIFFLTLVFCTSNHIDKKECNLWYIDEFTDFTVEESFKILDSLGMQDFYLNAKWMAYYTNFNCDSFQVFRDTFINDLGEHYTENQKIKIDFHRESTSINIYSVRIDRDTIQVSFTINETQNNVQSYYLPLCEFSSLSFQGIIGNDSVYLRVPVSGFLCPSIFKLASIDNQLTQDSINENIPSLFLSNSWESFYTDSQKNKLIYEYLKHFDYTPRKIQEREFARRLKETDHKDIKPWLIKELERRNYY